MLSGNRNFEGRVHAEVKMNFLASPPLVVAYALAGTMDIDLNNEPIGTDTDGKPVFLKDIWPSAHEVATTVGASVDSAMFKKSYASVFTGDEHWQAIEVPKDEVYQWEATSTYVRNPPYFHGMTMTPGAVADIRGARALAVLGDSVTTDHISPAGNIAKSSPAAKYLMAQGVQPADFNQYGARRGNHEVMMRGTFANIRLRNLLLPGTEGGVTLHIPTRRADVDLRRGHEVQGRGHAADRDRGQGVRHRLIARLGREGHDAARREGRDRRELRAHPPLEPDRHGRAAAAVQGRRARAVARADRQGELRDHRPQRRRGEGRHRRRDARRGSGAPIKFEARVRIDTPKEREYFQHGGILQYVIRQLASQGKAA